MTSRKQVYDLLEKPGPCSLLSKDRITVGDSVKAHDLQEKSEISNTTNTQVCEDGLRKTSWIQVFYSKKMSNDFPLRVTRRLVTGSYLKRNTGMEGQDDVDIMKKTTVLVFEHLQRAWNPRNYALIDMKVEFGVDEEGHFRFKSKHNFINLFSN
uniref:phosphoribosylaminoimidazolesuccinocarboxamide synthase n=1 Tax=Glossina austeni TaxID=7395 RepID=A0A1A9UWR5_GLOAU